MTRTLLLALTLAGCATTPVQAPEVPRLRCMNLGPVPASSYFVYLCEFVGTPPEVPTPEIPAVLEGS